ncbi:MAG: N-acetyl-alpha-D-glucosaminyl L-malate synthase BshA, partial [Sphingobacteriaceae bacterium]
NTGGIPELNVDGVTGFMTNVGDVKAMAEKAVYILEDDERLQQFKDNALARAKEFDLSLILPLYEDYYREVIERSKVTA